MLFKFLLSSAVGCLEQEEKKYSENVHGRASAGLDVSQCCLQQLPPDDQFSDPHLWNGPIVTTCKVKASSKSRKVVELWRRALAPGFQCGHGSVRLSRLDKHFSAGLHSKLGRALPCYYVSLSHFDMSSHLFCTDQKASKGFRRLSQIRMLLRCSPAA